MPTAQRPESAPPHPLSSLPRGATAGWLPSPGFFPGTVAAIAGQEIAMNETRTNALGRLAARAAVLVAGLVLALAVGAPWLLYDAPPSLEAVVAARACCAKAPAPAQVTPRQLPAR